MRRNLVHLADETVDVLLTVTGVTTLNVVLELASTETTVGVGQLEGPEEVVGLLEVRANGVDLVDQILHADNAELAEVLLDDLVVGEGSALLVDLSVTTLVQKLADGLQVGVTVGNVGVDDGQHLLGSLGETDESTRVDLEQTQELEDLAGLGSNLVDTLDTDNEDELGLTLNEEAALLASNAVEADLLALSGAVLLDVGLGTLEDNTTLLLVGLLGLLGLGTALSAGSLLRLALLQKGLGNEDLVLGGDGAVLHMLEQSVQRNKTETIRRVKELQHIAPHSQLKA